MIKQAEILSKILLIYTKNVAVIMYNFAVSVYNSAIFYNNATANNFTGQSLLKIKLV